MTKLFNEIKDKVHSLLVYMKHGKEHYTNSGTETLNALALLIALVLLVVLLALLGKWLWNTVLCRLVSGVKPVKSGWDIVGLHVLLSILFGFF